MGRAWDVYERGRDRRGGIGPVRAPVRARGVRVPVPGRVRPQRDDAEAPALRQYQPIGRRGRRAGQVRHRAGPVLHPGRADRLRRRGRRPDQGAQRPVGRPPARHLFQRHRKRPAPPIAAARAVQGRGGPARHRARGATALRGRQRRRSGQQDDLRSAQPVGPSARRRQPPRPAQDRRQRRRRRAASATLGSTRPI